MKQVTNNTTEAGAKRQQRAPNLVGDILTEMFSSNSPLAKGYRTHLATKENEAEKGGEV